MNRNRVLLLSLIILMLDVSYIPTHPSGASFHSCGRQLLLCRNSGTKEIDIYNSIKDGGSAVTHDPAGGVSRGFFVETFYETSFADPAAVNGNKNYFERTKEGVKS